MAALSSRALLLCAALLSAVGTIHSTTTQEYCDVCSTHTMCQFSGVGDACQEDQWFSGVQDSQQIVDLHNQLRNKVAVGDEAQGNPGPQPSATNMQRVAWDDELAEVAQRWTDQCSWGHDTCRSVPRFYVGQNLYQSSSWPCDSVNNDQDWTSAVNSWYNEVSLMDKNTVSKFTSGQGTGHYTQVVWANSYLVGCGFTSYKSDNQCKKYYACNYGPGGNYLNTPVYEEGDARSNCPSNTDVDSRYPGLC